MCILAPQCSCRLPIFVLLALNSISVLGTQLDTLSMEGMRLLKMVHYGFKDLQIYFALEIFGNLPQLKVDTKISPSQSILHFSRHSFYLKKIFFSVFCLYFSLCADQTGSTPHLFPLAVCDPNLVAWGTGKHLACL